MVPSAPKPVRTEGPGLDDFGCHPVVSLEYVSHMFIYVPYMEYLPTVGLDFMASGCKSAGYVCFSPSSPLTKSIMVLEVTIAGKGDSQRYILHIYICV